MVAKTTRLPIAGVNNNQVSQARSNAELLREILDKVDERTIFQYYFPIKLDLRRNKYTNPFRHDKSIGSCHFNYLSNGRLYFFDKSSGERFDVFSYVSRLYGLTFSESLRRIDSDLSLGLIKTPEHKASASYEEFRLPDVIYSFSRRSWSTYDTNYWTKYGINISQLEKYNVLPVSSVRVSFNQYSWTTSYEHKDCDPCYVYRNFNDEGNLHVKFYRPLAPKKELKWRSSVFTGFHTFGYDQLPETGEYLFVVSSLKDGLCLANMGYSNFIVLSSESSIAVPEIDELRTRFEHIIYILDRDKAGIASMMKASEVYKTEYIVIPNHLPKDIADTWVDETHRTEIQRYLKQRLQSIFKTESTLVGNYY